jgi:hypothetical protein
MDEHLKRLVEELGLAINDSISTSEQISEVVGQIEDEGCSVLLFLNVTIAITKRHEKSVSLPCLTSSKPESEFNRGDVQFLKSMHITLNR